MTDRELQMLDRVLISTVEATIIHVG